MLTGADGRETDEWDLHSGNCAESIPGGVRDIESAAVSTHADQDERVEGHQTSDEGVATPRSDHVSVEESAQRTPHDGAQLEGLDPQVEGEDQKEDGNGLIVVRAGDGSRDVTGGNAHEDGGEEAGGRRGGHLIGEEVSGIGRQAGAGGGQEDTDVANIDGDREEAEEVVEDTAGDHETRVQSTTGNSTQRVPCSVIEPIPEVVETVRNEVLGSSEVEPGVDCLMLVADAAAGQVKLS